MTLVIGKDSPVDLHVWGLLLLEYRQQDQLALPLQYYYYVSTLLEYQQHIILKTLKPYNIFWCENVSPNTNTLLYIGHQVRYF
jgi:hypothetical protein